MLRKSILATLAAVGLMGAMAVSEPAKASVLAEAYTFTGSVYSVSGHFTYENTNDHVLTFGGNVLSNNAADPGGVITGLAPGSGSYHPSGSGGNYFTMDNTYDPTSQTFGGQGLVFLFGTGNVGNFYDNPSPNVYLSTWLPDGNNTGPLFIPGDTGSFSVAAVPEPATWAMMMLGFAAVGFAAYRKKSTVRFRMTSTAA